jgi:hypothetical protein
MSLRHVAAAVGLAVLVASPALGGQYTVKVSLSRKDPNVSVGKHVGTDPVEFYVFVDGEPTRGGEFGLSLEGGECLGFQPDPDLPWISLPMVHPYPGTIAQATAGEKCVGPPTCFGKLIVKPSSKNARIVVDVIPSTRANEAEVIDCDLSPTNWFVAYPAVVNPGSQEPPAPHVVQKPGDPPIVFPDPNEKPPAAKNSKDASGAPEPQGK